MSVIYYKRLKDRLECENIKNDKEDRLCLRFEEGFKGSLRLGKLIKKIDGNSCVFDTGSLADGIYHPKIHIKGAIVELEAFEIIHGEAKLIPKDDAYIRELSREIEAQRREIANIKDLLTEFDKKINGTPIF